MRVCLKSERLMSAEEAVQDYHGGNALLASLGCIGRGSWFKAAMPKAQPAEMWKSGRFESKIHGWDS